MRTAGFLIAGRSGAATPGLFRFARWVISSGHHAEAHTKSVPGIDGADYKRQIYKFFIIEVWPDFFKHGIGTWSCATSVNDSVQAKAACSRAVKKGASRHALNARYGFRTAST